MEMLEVNTKVTYITKNELKYSSLDKKIEDITIQDVSDVEIVANSCVLIISILSPGGRYQQKLLKSRY